MKEQKTKKSKVWTALIIILLLFIIIVICNSFYTVQYNSQAIVKRFGKILKIEPETEKIICTYKTAAKAAKENGIDPSNLSKAIKSGRLLGGYKWQRRKD